MILQRSTTASEINSTMQTFEPMDVDIRDNNGTAASFNTLTNSSADDKCFENFREFHKQCEILDDCTACNRKTEATEDKCVQVNTLHDMCTSRI